MSLYVLLICLVIIYSIPSLSYVGWSFVEILAKFSICADTLDFYSGWHFVHFMFCLPDCETSNDAILFISEASASFPSFPNSFFIVLIPN